MKENTVKKLVELSHRPPTLQVSLLDQRLTPARDSHLPSLRLKVPRSTPTPINSLPRQIRLPCRHQRIIDRQPSPLGEPAIGSSPSVGAPWMGVRQGRSPLRQIPSTLGLAHICLCGLQQDRSNSRARKGGRVVGSRTLRMGALTWVAPTISK